MPFSQAAAILLLLPAALPASACDAARKGPMVSVRESQSMSLPTSQTWWVPAQPWVITQHIPSHVT